MSHLHSAQSWTIEIEHHQSATSTWLPRSTSRHKVNIPCNGMPCSKLRTSFVQLSTYPPRMIGRPLFQLLFCSSKLKPNCDCEPEQRMRYSVVSCGVLICRCLLNEEVNTISTVQEIVRFPLAQMVPTLGQVGPIVIWNLEQYGTISNLKHYIVGLACISVCCLLSVVKAAGVLKSFRNGTGQHFPTGVATPLFLFDQSNATFCL